MYEIDKRVNRKKERKNFPGFEFISSASRDCKGDIHQNTCCRAQAWVYEAAVDACPP